MAVSLLIVDDHAAFRGFVSELLAAEGFEVARQIAALEHGPPVVLTSLRAASDYGRRISDSPAMGFLPKQQLSGAALAALLASPGPCA